MRTARVVAVTSVAIVAGIVLLVWLVGLLGREVVSSSDASDALATPSAAAVEASGPPTPQTLAEAIVEPGSAGLRLQLPIRRQAVSGIAFGPRRERGVLELEPSGTRANTSWVRRTTQRFLATTPANDLRWYRLEDGAPSMVIVGALPGTEVYAPIDGTVEAIGEYVIDGVARGQVIQLQPIGDGQTLVVLRNLEVATDLMVGTSVTQGVTRLGSVRDMEGALEAPLADYTHDSGSGIDMYVLRTDVAGSSVA
ncbi:MAG: hypothetical protein JWM86_1348 [Thermoleophilia bacterium]|nr:hypothetical protein [Thermoleophilia bacterium]